VVPARATYSFTLQVVQPSQSAAFVPLLKRPEAHGAQARSVVVLPTAETNSPALQSRCSTQTVAALRS
jgi:hypothetical protein